MSRKKEKKKIEHEICGVCLEDLKDGQKLEIYCQLGHTFHEKCYNDLIENEITFCPICRGEPTDNTKKLLNKKKPRESDGSGSGSQSQSRPPDVTSQAYANWYSTLDQYDREMELARREEGGENMDLSDESEEEIDHGHYYPVGSAGFQELLSRPQPTLFRLSAQERQEAALAWARREGTPGYIGIIAEGIAEGTRHPISGTSWLQGDRAYWAREWAPEPEEDDWTPVADPEDEEWFTSNKGGRRKKRTRKKRKRKKTRRKRKRRRKNTKKKR